MDKIISYLVERLAISERRVNEIMLATISVLKQRLRLHEWILINNQAMFFVVKKSECVLIDPVHYTKVLIPPTFSLSLTTDISSFSDIGPDVIVRDLTTLVSIQADLDELNTQNFIKELVDVFSQVLLEDSSLRVDDFGVFKRINKRGTNPAFHRNNAYRIFFFPEASFNEEVNKAFSFFEPSVFEIKELPNNVTFSLQREKKSELIESKEDNQLLELKNELPVSPEIESTKEIIQDDSFVASPEKEIPQTQHPENGVPEIKEEKKIADFLSNFLSISSNSEEHVVHEADRKHNEITLVDDNLESTASEEKPPVVPDDILKTTVSEHSEKIENSSHKEDFSGSIELLLSEAKKSVQPVPDVNHPKEVIAEKSNDNVPVNKNDQARKNDFSDAIASMLNVAKDDFQEIVTGVKSGKDASNNDDLSALYTSEAISEKIITELDQQSDDKNAPIQQRQVPEPSDSIYNQIDIDAVMNAVKKEEEVFSPPEEESLKPQERPRSLLPQQDTLLNSFDIDEIMNDVDEHQLHSGHINKDVSSTTSNLDTTKTNDVVAFFAENQPDKKINDSDSSRKNDSLKDDVVPEKKSDEKKRPEKYKKKHHSVFDLKYMLQHYFILIIVAVLAVFALGFLFSKIIEKNAKPEIIEVNPVNEAVIDDQIDNVLSEDDAIPAKEEPVPVEKKSDLATVVVQGDSTLQDFSVRFYGNEAFWIYLYEANKDEIPDIHQLKPGTRLVVPSPEVYNLDIASENAILSAKRKGDALLNKDRSEMP